MHNSKKNGMSKPLRIHKIEYNIIDAVFLDWNFMIPIAHWLIWYGIGSFQIPQADYNTFESNYWLEFIH